MKAKSFGFAILAVIILAGAFLFLPAPTQKLKTDTTWDANSELGVIKRRILVPNGVTLTVKAGTQVRFGRKAGLIVNGKLLAYGTKDKRVRIKGTDKRFLEWHGISFIASSNDNRMDFVEVANNVSRESLITINDSTVTLSNMSFTNVQRQILEIYDSNVIVRDSVFPSVGEHEVISGARIAPRGQLLIEGNEFRPNTGYKDIIDFSDCARPGPIPHIADNSFRGGGDDGLDLDRCDAEVYGNSFTFFVREGHEKYASAVSLGNVSQVTISNNFFFKNDHGVTTQGSSKATVLDCHFREQRIAAISFKEGDHPPGAAHVDNCEFKDNPMTFKHGDEAKELVVQRSVLPEAARWPDADNGETRAKRDAAL